MKVRVLYSCVACITCILTVLIFIDFRKQWEASQIFQRSTDNTSITLRHLFISPEEVKVEDWQVGNAATYQLKTNLESKQISFQVAARDTENNNRFWLKTDGLFQLNKVDVEVWRLLDTTNLRPGSEIRGFYFSRNAIPFPFPPIKSPQGVVVLEELGDAVIVTPMGTIKCKHVFAYIRSPNGKLVPLLELWTNPTLRPLGLVRARWQDESLDLVQVTRKIMPEIPPILLAEFDRNTQLDGSCARCHTEEIGGKDLKLESMNWLVGTTLNFTTALFHHRKAEMIEENELFYLALMEGSARSQSKALIRFSWGKGSFWVKPNEFKELTFSLDAIAHKGNITAQLSKGRLALNLQQQGN